MRWEDSTRNLKDWNNSGITSRITALICLYSSHPEIIWIPYSWYILPTETAKIDTVWDRNCHPSPFSHSSSRVGVDYLIGWARSQKGLLPDMSNLGAYFYSHPLVIQGSGNFEDAVSTKVMLAAVLEIDEGQINNSHFKNAQIDQGRFQGVEICI